MIIRPKRSYVVKKSLYDGTGSQRVIAKWDAREDLYRFQVDYDIGYTIKEGENDQAGKDKRT
jgi:hypothetical protein